MTTMLRRAAASLSRGLLVAGLLLGGLLAPARLLAQQADVSRVAYVPPTPSLAPGYAAPAAPAPEVVPRKSGFVAFLLEYLVPGLGHMYARDTWGALNIVGVYLSGLMMAFGSENDSAATGGAILAVGARMYGLIDAPRAAGRYNRKHQPSKPLP